MAMSDTQETSIRRANAAMRRFIQSIRFIFFEIAIVGLFATIAFYYVPNFITADTMTAYQVIMPIIGLLLGLLFSWLFFLARAPHLQRNEERNKLEEKSIPVPIFNSAKLANTMTEVVSSAYNCVQLKYIAATLGESKHPSTAEIQKDSEQAYEQYGQTREKLKNEVLVTVGGKRFEGISFEVQKLIDLLDRDVSKFYGDKRPDLDVAAQKIKYNIALEEAIKRIDKIGQSVSDKG
jgi:hypothetical protein